MRGQGAEADGLLVGRMVSAGSGEAAGCGWFSALSGLVSALVGGGWMAEADGQGFGDMGEGKGVWISVDAYSRRRCGNLGETPAN